ncbi:DMT family transporter [Bacillus horti]|uniref:Drug/metabolite transporter (DMT)-like permease n=1 Tax=Caldalkalibacillus horti TaxID=77523 RepID=A0ABT9VVG0_9BACI|nr:DMT family transporter [Bacillus horti]MDQ0164870.1 drug/metabolite transporter (DMT)-like permease [Bacillus horti]
MSKNNGLGLVYLFAVINSLIVGFSFLFTKVALDYAPPIDTLAFRFAVAFLVMSIPVLFGRIKLSYKGKPVFKAILLASMYPLGFFTLQAFGLQHATSAEGGILHAFTPILTLTLAFIFLKEVTTTLQKLSISLSIFGVIFIFVMKGSTVDLSNMTGISLLFLACLSIAGYSVLARFLLKSFRPVEITFLTLAVGFSTFLIYSVTQHAIAGTLTEFLVPLTNRSFVFSIFYLGILSSLITSLISSYSLSKIEASKMSVFANMSTIVSMAAGAMFQGEVITVYHIIGATCIIAGVIGTQYFHRNRVLKAPSLSSEQAKV